MKQWAISHYKINIDMDYCASLFGESERDIEMYQDYAKLDFDAIKDRKSNSQGIIYSCYCNKK